MSTENQELESEVNNHNALPGEILRQRREELGLSQKDISERLRLKVSVIESIENNQFDSHHVATFIRGYFRSYAKAVGIKEKEILAALDQSGRGQHKDQPMHSFSQKTKKQQHDNHIMRLTWGILIIILGISSVWWWQNHQLDTLSPSSLSSHEEEHTTNNSDESLNVNNDASFETVQMANESSELSPQHVKENELNLSESFEQPKETLESTDSEVLPDDGEIDPTLTEREVGQAENQDQVDTPAQVNTVEQEKNNNSLAMEFKDDCWIQVKDSAGLVLATGLKKAGESLTLEGKAPYSIILGAPEGVSISLADEPVDLSKYTPGKVARFTLP